MLVTFKDGAVVELHDDCVFVVELSETDVEFNITALVGSDVQIFNMINNRLDGVLSH